MSNAVNFADDGNHPCDADFVKGFSDLFMKGVLYMRTAPHTLKMS